MNSIKLSDNLSISPLVHGHWRMQDWNMSSQELLKLIQQTIDLGITTFDHADIYGDYSCEKIFGDTLSKKKELRKDIQIITKCGIKLLSDKFPERKIKYFDYSFEHIIASVENSLSNFRTDYIDLLLLHRPSPFFNPEEVAKAFSYLKNSGKVLNFGVSNFNPQQFEMLDKHIENPLVTNQVEISPLCLENFENGNMDFFVEKLIKPMAWSPLGGGKLLIPKSKKEQRIFNSLTEVAIDLDVSSIDTIIYSWLLKHPANIIPIVGSGRYARIKNAVEALNVEMTIEQWFQIYIASLGEDLP